MERLTIKAQRERRKAERAPEFSACVIFDFHSAVSIPCLARYVSSEGAQLRISPDAPVESKAYLLNLINGTAHYISPVWREHSLMGVKFEGTHSVDSTLPAQLGRLKEVWADAKLDQTNRIDAYGVCTRDEQLLLASGYASEARANRRFI